MSRDFYVIRGQELWNNGGGAGEQSSQLSSAGWGGGWSATSYCCSYYGTDFARQRLQLCVVEVVGWRICGEVIAAATLSDPHPSPGKSNLVNTTVDGQIPIGEGDHI